MKLQVCCASSQVCGEGNGSRQLKTTVRLAGRELCKGSNQSAAQSVLKFLLVAYKKSRKQSDTRRTLRAILKRALPASLLQRLKDRKYVDVLIGAEASEGDFSSEDDSSEDDSDYNADEAELSDSDSSAMDDLLDTGMCDLSETAEITGCW